MSERATERQKSYIKDLLDRAEFDTRTVGILHKRWGAEDRHVGKSVDAWLGDLNQAQASRLIDKLKEEVDDEDEDDE